MTNEELMQLMTNAWLLVANKAIEIERESCARVCEERADSYKHETDVYAYEHVDEANRCAAAIRARGDK